MGTITEELNDAKSEVSEAAMSGLIKVMGPKIDEFSRDIADYLGDNEKIIIMARPSLKHAPIVMIFDNTKYVSIQCGEMLQQALMCDSCLDKKIQITQAKIQYEESAILKKWNVKQFISDLLSGKMKSTDENTSKQTQS